MPTWTTCEWIRSEVSDNDVDHIEAALDVSPGWKVEISKLWDVELGGAEDGEVPFNEATFFALHEHTGFGIDVDYWPEHEPGGTFRISVVPGDSNWETYLRTSTTDYDEVPGLIEYAMARVSFG